MMAYSTKVDNKEFPRKYLGEAKPVRINICEMGMAGHERGQSTTYKPCGIQCNIHLFSLPKRGLRLEFRSLGGLRAAGIAGNHQRASKFLASTRSQDTTGLQTLPW